ncbi:MAG TPA: NYN domain-containing protein, partial [Rhodoglobus sp.]|nr:NYN domain-containing protein [Rhodoglobus sp.]
RVAVYIDFDNIVISQYDAVHGRGAFIKEKARGAAGKTGDRLQEATVNIGAVLDFASSFGAVAISRAYADWAAPANTRYQKQLVDRAVDLVQLFNTSGTKNGADIRLAIDVVEDLFRLRDITHIVIVAGDSDYIPLAQSARRLGRTVIGIGVQGSTSAAFKNACDEFSYYGDLVDDEPAPPATAEPVAPDPKRDAVELMVRALRVRRGDDNVDGWVAASGLKQQMKRLDAGFDEKKIGYKSFTDFVKAQSAVAELQEDGQARRVRLRDRG